MQECFFSLKLTESIEQKKREIDFEIDRIKNNNFSSLVFKFNGILMSMYAFDSGFVCVCVICVRYVVEHSCKWLTKRNRFFHFISFFLSSTLISTMC